MKKEIEISRATGTPTVNRGDNPTASSAGGPRNIRKPGPYAVVCHGPWDMAGGGCGRVFLTEAEYDAQMNRPDSTWRCPLCRYEADWDDDNYEAWLDAAEANHAE